MKLKSFYDDRRTQNSAACRLWNSAATDEPGFVFLCTHLDYRPPDDERMASAETINELAFESMATGLMILAGDFNAMPESRVIARVREACGRSRRPNCRSELTRDKPLLTYPSEQAREVDRLRAVRPADRWEMVEVRVLDEPVASDHRPLLAVLRRAE